MFGAKIDYVSPVWLQVQHKGKNKYEIAGTHDVDAKWIQEVRKAGGKKSKFNKKRNLKIKFSACIQLNMSLFNIFVISFWTIS